MSARTLRLLRSASLCLLLASVLPIRGEEAPNELAEARAAYERDVEFSTRPIRDRYLTKLEALKRTFGGRGDVRAALAIQEEIDRIKASSAGAADFARFAGDWKINFNNGRTRHYTISADGMVTWDEENGQKLPPKRVQISRQGQHFLLQAADVEVERLSISSGQLVVEHFFPKSAYPAGPPEMTGRANNNAAK